MKLERLCDENRHLFDAAFSIYVSAFPKEERREKDEQDRVIKNECYHFDMILEDNELLGIMLYWEVGKLIFLEHFATSPAIRNRGIGTAALEMLKAKGKTVMLEIEPPTDEITERRYGFYKRNGFVMNPHHHIQAKYHLGDPDLELKILSYPRALTDKEYRDFYEYMTASIGISAAIAKDVTIRPMQDGDDAVKIGRLIYLTDPYIYPYWFDSIEIGERVLAKMICLPTMYQRENITVAIDASGEIAGVAVSEQTPFRKSEDDIIRAFEKAGVKPDERTRKIFLDYYDKMGDETDGYYIANLATDPKFRGRGIGAAMLSYITKDKPLATLECVVKNSSALRLYQRMGFKIDFEYPGVFDIPCYKMSLRKSI